jgi:hypothetical protein
MVGMMVSAQDEDVTESERNGTIAITLTEGTTVTATDDGFLMTIVSELDFAPTVSIDAEGNIRSMNYPLIEIQGDWEFAGDLETTALLTIDREQFEVTLNSPVYDVTTDELQFFISEIEGVEVDKDGNPDLPEIESGSLVITMDNMFISALLEGRADRFADMRGGSWCSDPDCF